jgi:Leucine-rich repeat (LRR) protein
MLIQTTVRYAKWFKDVYINKSEDSFNAKVLKCYCDRLTVLPKLSSSLEILCCSCNKLTVLPELPYGVYSVNCSNNQLIEITSFPLFLKYLYCDNNQLTGIPETLPTTLEILWCDNNKLTALPSSLTQCKQLYDLRCSGNQFNEDTNRILNKDIPVQQKIKELDENGLLEYNNDFVLK